MQRATENQLPMRGHPSYPVRYECVRNRPRRLLGLAQLRVESPNHPAEEIQAERVGKETSRLIYIPSVVVIIMMSIIRHLYPDPREPGQPTETGGLKMLC